MIGRPVCDDRETKGFPSANIAPGKGVVATLLPFVFSLSAIAATPPSFMVLSWFRGKFDFSRFVYNLP